MGRPTKRTPEIETKLEYAFSIGSTVLSACFYAEIGESTSIIGQAKIKSFWSE